MVISGIFQIHGFLKFLIFYWSDYDPSRDCGVLDEDPLLDDLEEIQKEGNNIFEYHGADLFPERWFKLVVVLNTGFYCLHADPHILKNFQIIPSYISG